MTERALRFDGEVAVVTGAGSGLGRAYARALAERGALVVCNDIDPTAAAATVELIGGNAVAETSSVATPSSGAAIVQCALDSFGSIEIVVNNAGQLRNDAFEEMSVEQFDSVISTHLSGAFHVTQPAYRFMKTAGHGRIIFTSSAAGMFGSPWQANYAAAKAGLFGLCKVVALEGERHGITANAIMPMALTDINRGGAPPFAPEHLEEMVTALAPLAPTMTVDNVAPFVVYLSHRACTSTGRIFSVGCGHLAEVFVGAAHGWYSDALTAEQIASNLDAASDRRGYVVPESMLDEVRFIAEHAPK